MLEREGRSAGERPDAAHLARYGATRTISPFQFTSFRTGALLVQRAEQHGTPQTCGVAGGMGRQPVARPAGRRGRARILAAARALARRPRLPRRNAGRRRVARDADLGVGTLGRNPAHRGFRHPAGRLRQPRVRREASRHGAPHRPRPLRIEHRVGDDRRGVRDVRTHAGRSRFAVRLHRGMGDDREAHLVRRRAVRSQRNAFQPQARAREAQAVPAGTSDADQRRTLHPRTRVRDAARRRALHLDHRTRKRRRGDPDRARARGAWRTRPDLCQRSHGLPRHPQGSRRVLPPSRLRAR